MRNNFLGREATDYRLYGVVEDRFDPLEAGRLKVRYFGWHTEDKTKLPTKDLPWSYPIISIDSGRMNTVGIREGAWVAGFLMDGPMGEFPVVYGIISGIPEAEAEPARGFFDPRPDSLLAGHQVPREPQDLTQHADGSGNDIVEIPKKSRFPDDRFLKESDTSRYGRGQELGTVVPEKKANVAVGQTNVPTANHPAGTGTDRTSSGGHWTERKTAYKPKYPYNKAYFSEGGHLIEVDDTPYKERLHWMHRTGSFKEIDPVGAVVEKIVDKQYHVVLEDRMVHIEAADEETVDWGKKVYVNKDGKSGFNYDVTVGPNGDLNFTTEKGKLNIHILGDDCNLKVEGDWNFEIDGDLNGTVHGKANVKVEKDCNIEVNQNLNGTVDGRVDLHVKGSMSSKVEGYHNTTVGKDMCAFVAGNLASVVHGDADLSCALDLNAWVGRDAYLDVVNNVRQVVGGKLINYVSGDRFDVVLGDYTLLVGGNFANYVLGNINREAVGNVWDSGAVVDRAAVTSITDAAPLISHNAAITNCSAILTGITVDSDGDVTEAGPPGALWDAHDPEIKYPAKKLIVDALIAAKMSPEITTNIDSFPGRVESIYSLILCVFAQVLTSHNPSNWKSSSAASILSSLFSSMLGPSLDYSITAAEQTFLSSAPAGFFMAPSSLLSEATHIMALPAGILSASISDELGNSVLSSFVEGIHAPITGEFSSIISDAIALAQSSLSAVPTQITSSLQSAIQVAVDAADGLLGTVIGDISPTALAGLAQGILVDSLSTFSNTAMGTTLTSALADALDGVIDSLGQIIGDPSAIAATLSNTALGSLDSAVGTVLAEATDQITSLLSGVVAQIEAASVGVLSGVPALSHGLIDSITNSVLSGVMQTVSSGTRSVHSIQIPSGFGSIWTVSLGNISFVVRDASRSIVGCLI